MAKLRVGVLRGGPSNEHSVSLKTGGNILEQIRGDYDALDIFIDKAGVWHIGGIPVSVARVADKIDIAVNALHGKYGEDGKVQRELERFGIPYTGSGALASAVAMNKLMTKETLQKAGIKTPYFTTVSKGDDIGSLAPSIFRTFPHPSVVKPAMSGSSVGVTVATDIGSLVNAIREASEISDIVIIEEYIRGREATCGIIENFRGEEYYILPPIEIRVPNEHAFFNYTAKYGGGTEEICPSSFDTEEKKAIADITRSAHKILGLRHYSRSDFIVSSNGIYFLEVNTLPGLTSESLFPKAINAVGSNLSEFLNHIILSAYDKTVGKKY